MSNRAHVLARKTLAIYRILIDVLIGGFTSMLVMILLVLPNFGIRAYEVVSGSMEPVFPVGCLILLNEHDRDFTVGDIVAYHIDIPELDPITHRIYAAGDIPGTWKMKGDANPSVDFEGTEASNISEDRMIGTVFCCIPILGAVLWFLHALSGPVLIILLAALFFSPDILQAILGALSSESVGSQPMAGQPGTGFSESRAR